MVERRLCREGASYCTHTFANIKVDRVTQTCGSNSAFGKSPPTAESNRKGAAGEVRYTTLLCCPGVLPYLELIVFICEVFWPCLGAHVIVQSACGDRTPSESVSFLSSHARKLHRGVNYLKSVSGRFCRYFIPSKHGTYVSSAT